MSATTSRAAPTPIGATTCLARPADEPTALLSARRPALAVKRVVDVTVAAVALLVAFPALAIIGVGVMATSRGPALFVHHRVGREGVPFRLYKFRTMRIGTDAELLASGDGWRRHAGNDYKLPADDPRITRFGRLLRASSLDELPQLVNVLKGDMSVVGIRPLIAVELAERDPYDRACYCTMRPGLTGLWQTEGRSSMDPIDRRALDREYVETWSNRNDLRLLRRTPAAVLRFHHAA